MTVTYRIFQVLLCAAIVTIGLLFSSCAEKSDDMLLETEEEDLVTEEIIPPRPDWDDGVMTITVGGRFETKEQMLQALEREFLVGDITKESIQNEEFIPTPPEKRYTVDIAVRTMLEAGFTEPVTLREIKSVYWEQGYGPLTFEEVLELRLQLKDQPHSGTGHRMTDFYTLPTSSYTMPCAYSISSIKEDGEVVRQMYGSSRLDSDHLHDPNHVYLHWLQQAYRPWIDVEVSPKELPLRFAATVRGSVVRTPLATTK